MTEKNLDELLLNLGFNRMMMTEFESPGSCSVFLEKAFGLYCKWSVACAVILASSIVALGSPNEDSGSILKKSVEYDLNIKFAMVTRLVRPETGMIVGVGAGSSYASVGGISSSQNRLGPRTLGLTHFRGITTWTLGGFSSLEVLFRPDYDLYPRLDSRSGEVYRERPPLQLLDGYLLHGSWNQDVSLSFGVWETLVTDWTSYPPNLEFGLKVLFPEHFLGGRLRFSLDNSQRGVGKATKPTRGIVSMPLTVLDVYVHSSNGDRGELRASSAKTYDIAPVNKSPHWGGAISASSVFSSITMGSLLGFNERRDSYGRVAESIFQMGLSKEWKNVASIDYDLQLSSDFRFAHEDWKDDQNLRKLSQTSLSTQGILCKKAGCWQIGFHLGEGQHHGIRNIRHKRRFSGYQWDLGLVNRWSSGLEFALEISDEHRETWDLSQQRIGGFYEDGERSFTNRRVSLSVTYSTEKLRTKHRVLGQGVM